MKEQAWSIGGMILTRET